MGGKRKIGYQDGRTCRAMGDKVIWLAVAAVVVSLGGIDSAFAVAPTPAFTWNATGSSDYNTLTNWDPNLTAAPSNGENQFLTINNGATAVINDYAEGAFLILGLSTGQSGNLVINSGTSIFGEMRVGGRETVPDDYNSETPTYLPNNGGTGTVIQNPGTVVYVNYNAGTEPPVASLYVGDSAGLTGNTANGSYTINGTETSPSVLTSGFSTDDAIVVGTGSGTVGTFTQNPFTTVTSTGFIIIGRRGSTGTYNLNGGDLYTWGGNGTSLYIGDGDTDGLSSTSGTFNQTGGTLNVTGAAHIGKRNGQGFYNISGGSLTTSAEIRVGDWGATTNPSLGNAQGTLTVSGTGSITVGTNLNVGIGIGSNSLTAPSNVVGTLIQTGGSITLSAANAVTAIGNGLGDSGTANLSGGTFTQTGGSAVFDIGRNNSSGIVNISGTHVMNVKQITVNSTNVAAMRQLNISGGTVNVDLITFGSVSSMSTRALNITGGNVHIGMLTTGNPNLGAGGSAITTISNNATPVIDSLELFSNSTFKVLSNLTLVSTVTGSPQPNYRFGTSTLEVGPAATLTINGPGNFGTGTAQTLTKTGAGTVTLNLPQTYFAGSATKINEGTINYNSAVEGTNLTVTVNSPGILGGTGTVGGAVTNNGTIAPGVASGTNIGTLTTNGNVTSGDNSNWAIELNGALSDKLAVNGNIDLSAFDSLNVAGSPGASTSWTIATYTGGLTGVFDNITPGYSVAYTGGNITLSLAAGLLGDFNSDGKVDAGDYVTWRKNDGPNASLPNDNGAGNQAARYSLWRAHFGTPPGSGSSLDGGNVPEPATWILVAMVVAFVAVTSRRRQMEQFAFEPVR